MKISKFGPLSLPDNARASGTQTVDDQDVFNPSEEKSWIGTPIDSKTHELPIAYLAEAVAWQEDGSTPEESFPILIYGDKKRSPLVPPKVVVLRGFQANEAILDGVMAKADALRAADIMVIKDPYRQVQSTGLYPGLPITAFETMDTGHPDFFGNNAVSVGVIEIEEFVGGEILEIFKGSERESFGFYRNFLVASNEMEIFPDYHETYFDLDTAKEANTEVVNNHSDNSTGITTTYQETWNFSIALIDAVNPDPPPSTIYIVRGLVDETGGGFGNSATFSIVGSTRTSFQWDELITRSVGYFTTWIEQCYRYRTVVLMETGTDVNPPVETHIEEPGRTVDIVVLDGINPAVRAAVKSWADQVGADIVDVTSGDEYDNDALAAVIAQIEDFFNITL